MRILLTTFFDPNHLGIRLLGAVAKQAGHEVGILQMRDFRYVPVAPGDDSRQGFGYRMFMFRYFQVSKDSTFPITDLELALFEDAITAWKPDILGFTLRSPYNHLLPLVLPVMRRAAPSALLVGGGFGPTYEPGISLTNGADVVVRGEGEGALRDLIECLQQGRDWREVRNCAFLRNGQLVQNPLRPLLRNFDAHPFPLYYDADFISIENGKRMDIDMRFRSGSTSVYVAPYVTLTSRGCIANCSYCAAGHWRDQYARQGLFAPRYRCRSIDNVLQELHVAKEHGEKQITLNDEYFIRSTNELLVFFHRYRKEIDLPFFAHLNHRQLMSSPELLKVVKQVMYNGFIPLGVQSGSESFARNIYNRKNNNQEYLDFIRLCMDNGLSGSFHIIGGNALESEDEEEALYDFCAQVPFDPSLKVDWQIHSAMLKLLDGSPLAEKHPELRDAQYPVKKYNRIMMLAELRNKVDGKTFAAIRNDPLYNDPERLFTLMKTILRDRHQQYLVKEIARLQGQEVYFWGCGEIYRYRRHLFEGLRPQCVLVDKGEYPQEVDGIPVKHPDNVLNGKYLLPIVIFSATPFIICHTINNKYQKYTDLISCAIL